MRPQDNGVTFNKSNLDPVQLTCELIDCESVTPHQQGTLDILTRILDERGFKCHRLTFDEPGTAFVENLYASIGSQPHPHFCFAGHVDVVPAGDISVWKYQPFTAIIKDDMLYGRGAVDMKGGIAAFVCALDSFLQQQDHLKGTISLLITADEEGIAINGTQKVIKWLHDQNIQIDFCMVGEPSSQRQLGDTIKVGRRGSLNTVLTIHGRQGHVANHHVAHNPIPDLLKCLTLINNGPDESKSQYFDATNVEITSIDVGNPAVNIIPQKATACFNIRFNDQHSGQSLQDWITQICQQQGGRFELKFSLSGEADHVLSPVHTDLLQQAVCDVTHLNPELSTSGGTSDARFIRHIAPVLEFGLVNQTMHQIDECVKVDDLKKLTMIYKNVLTRFFTI